jgi:hypothetical protein
LGGTTLVLNPGSWIVSLNQTRHGNQAGGVLQWKLESLAAYFNFSRWLRLPRVHSN